MSKVQTQRAQENERLTAESEEEESSSEGENQSEQPALSPGVLRVKVGAGVPSPCSSSGLDDGDFTDIARIKEEPEEQCIKQEAEERAVSVPESIAVRVKKEPSPPLRQRQTDHRKETQGISSDPDTYGRTQHPPNTGNREVLVRPFSCLAPQKAAGDLYNQLQNRDTAAQTSGPPIEYQKPYSCCFCEKRFAKKGQLDVHTRTHTGEKPYSCYFCEKLFAKKSNLDLHVRLHTGEKPYSCQYCEKTFAQISNLKVHMRTHTGEKPYKCSECEKTFAQKNTLKAHMKTHVTDKLHCCDVCARSFVHKTNLDVHMRIHTGERPYSCDFCEKTFTQNSNLKAHLRIHTGEKPYSCSMCEKTFAQKGTLDGHVKLHLQRESSQSSKEGD